MKKFLALALTAVLALTSVTVVFADEYDYATEEVVIEHVPFTGTSRLFTSSWGAIIGNVPAFANNTALTTRIHNMVNDYYYNFFRHDNISRPRPAGHEVFSFEVQESYTAARIDIFVLRDNLVRDTLYTFFVDKAANTVITAAAFAESQEVVVAAPVATAEEVEVDVDEDADVDAPVVEVEIDVAVLLEGMFPVRINAEAAGFTVNWDNGAVEVYDETLVLNILTGSVLATLTQTDEELVEVTLDAAPINVAGRVYVPYTLLVDILGIEFELLVMEVYVPVVALPAIIDEVEEDEEYEVEAVEEYEAEEYDVEEVEEYEAVEAYEEVDAVLAAAIEVLAYFVFEDEEFEVSLSEDGYIVFTIFSDAADLYEYAEVDGYALADDLREVLGEAFLGLLYIIVDLDGEVVFESFFQ